MPKLNRELQFCITISLIGEGYYNGTQFDGSTISAAFSSAFESGMRSLEYKYSAWKEFFCIEKSRVFAKTREK